MKGDNWDVHTAVYNAVEGAVYYSVRHPLNGAVYNAVEGAVDHALRHPVNGAVYNALQQALRESCYWDPPHSALQAFLGEVQ